MFAITLLLISFFLFASSIKLTGWQRGIFEIQLGFFENYGLNRQIMFIVGLIELTASLLLISALVTDKENLKSLGAIMIIFASIGASYFHLRFDTTKDALPAFITLTLSTMLLIN